MRKLTRTERVFYALVKNYKANGGFINDCRLAKEIHGNSYSRRTAYTLEKGIRDVMSKVEKLAMDNGFSLAKKRKPTKADPKKGFLILGWKLAVKGFDEDYVIDESIIKSNRAKAMQLAAKQYLDAAQINGLISSEKYKELEVKFQENLELIFDLLT